MTTKTVSTNVLDRLVQLTVSLIKFPSYEDIRMYYTAFSEAILAVACSCFPTIDMDVDINEDDEYEPPTTEQKTIKQN
ncbi:Hypothetical protein CINCED_3A016093 [Cinara cedri]|uniref:Uncharacterized protein n=1 Tax=Cinara cedri TaxID=506608 RepID=A0A5E4M4X7_9HEMI|nr:Hypothetical protein CINCED_3A016093 [Cinara cedri]